MLHVISPMASGGAETVVRALAGGSRRAGRTTTVAALLGSRDEAGKTSSATSDPHPFVQQLRAGGVPVVEVRCGNRQYLKQAWIVSQVARQVNATVVHTHRRDADLVGFLAARLFGIPIVSTVHGFTGTGAKSDLFIWLSLRLVRRFDAVICVSRDVRARVVRGGVDPERTHLITNGYVRSPQLTREAARARLGIGHSERVVAWVGRLTAEKGADLFVDAMHRLPSRDVQALIVGEGPDLASLATRANGAVRFVGRRDDAAALMPAFDVLVLSSRSEGTPMVLFEAMAADVPIVTFAVGGVCDIFDESTSWLVPPEDVEALARSIAAALDDPHEARQRADAARRLLESRFNEAAWLDQVWAAYRAAAASRTSTGSVTSPETL